MRFVRFPIVGRGSRAVEGASPYGFARFSIVGRGLRTVEDAGPYGWCAFPLLVADTTHPPLRGPPSLTREGY